MTPRVAPQVTVELTPQVAAFRREPRPANATAEQRREVRWRPMVAPVASRALAGPGRPPVLASPVGDAAGVKKRAGPRRHQRKQRVGELLPRAESPR